MNSCHNCGQTMPDGNCPVCTRGVDPEIIARMNALRAAAVQHRNFGRRRGGRGYRHRAVATLPLSGQDAALPVGDR